MICGKKTTENKGYVPLVDASDIHIQVTDPDVVIASSVTENGVIPSVPSSSGVANDVVAERDVDKGMCGACSYT